MVGNHAGAHIPVQPDALLSSTAPAGAGALCIIRNSETSMMWMTREKLRNTNCQVNADTKPLAWALGLFRLASN